MSINQHLSPLRTVREGWSPAAGVTLGMAAWIPERPRAIVIVAHGHAEHLDRYVTLINALVAEGYAVYGQDHRGHGRSSGTRALLMRFDDTVGDLHGLVTRAKADLPGLPLVIFGHSMGGLIAVRYALAHGHELAALVVSGAALVIDEGVSANAIRIGAGMAKLAPTAPMPRDNANRLTVDPDTAMHFRDDHLNHHGPTRVRTAMEMVEAGRDAMTRLASISIPLLAMHGADDRLTFPSGTRALVEQASSTDKTLKLWPGMLHEILNEADRASVQAAILAWLDARMPVPVV